MDSKEVIDELRSLVKTDIDAAHAYRQAIPEIDAPEIQAELGKFLDDHERHVMELTDALRGLGTEAPEYTRSFKGFIISGFTAIRAAIGIESALKAMRSNEKLTNRTYADAVKLDFPSSVKTIVQRNYDDEKRHLAYIEQTIAQKAWKEKVAAK
ncbi:MAG TPA: DUF2383 domain-containing protein [Phycisphaerae bacterium]|nr:DUF2383 domain-containing protein [Phycisphaerae bacterium]